MFAFDVAIVTGRDMQSTLGFGDVVLISKLRKDYRVNDLVWFEYPYPDSAGRVTMMLQRIGGVPGDSFSIVKKRININRFAIADTVTLRHNFFVQFRKKPALSYLDSLGLTEGGPVSDGNDYCYALTDREAAALRRDSLVKSVAIKVEARGDYDEDCFPHQPYFSWNRDHYGNIYVPRRHDVLRLDSVTYWLYAPIIRRERNIVDRRGDSIFINGSYARDYTVREDQYFVLGDNRDNANDSRVWGFLPVSAIKGVVNRVLRSRTR